MTTVVDQMDRNSSTARPSEVGWGHLAPAGRLAGDGPLFGFGLVVCQRE